MVVLFDVVDVVESGQSFREELVVGVVLLKDVEKGGISLHGYQFIN